MESVSYSTLTAAFAQIATLSPARGCPYCWDRPRQARVAEVGPSALLWPWFSSRHQALMPLSSPELYCCCCSLQVELGLIALSCVLNSSFLRSDLVRPLFINRL